MTEIENTSSEARNQDIKTHKKRLPAGLIFVLAWLIPGLGHFLMGEKKKGIIFFLAIVFAFLFGAVICEFMCLSIEEHNWAFLAQVGVGFLAIPIVWIKNNLGIDTTDPLVVNVLMDPGLLYTQVAGILNMLIAIDSWDRAGLRGRKEIGEGDRT